MLYYISFQATLIKTLVEVTSQYFANRDAYRLLELWCVDFSDVSPSMGRGGFIQPVDWLPESISTNESLKLIRAGNVIGSMVQNTNAVYRVNNMALNVVFVMD